METLRTKVKLTENDKDGLKKHIQEAVEASFSGWDFSYISRFGGAPESPLPWDYKDAVVRYKDNITSLLDIGTGGGEFLSTLAPFPDKAAATEAYKPNVKVARDKLNPLGVDVIGIEEGTQEQLPLPFEDDSFDLIIDRHECYESDEVHRILKPGGYFITQQVGCRNLEKLRTLFGSLSDNEGDEEFTYENALDMLKKTGLTIIGHQENIGSTKFYDIRTVVYFMKAIKWDFPDFNADDCYYQRLENIFYLIKRDGYFEDICHRFYVIARKG